MKINLIAFGKQATSWAEAAILDYDKRLPKQAIQLSLIELTASKKSQTALALEEEANKLDKYLQIPKNRYNVALDVNGQSLTSMALANTLIELQNNSQTLNLFIGSAVGLSRRIKDKMHTLWSISAMTLPHMLVRVILYEQIYRAWSINHKHPYHK